MRKELKKIENQRISFIGESENINGESIRVVS